MSLSVSARPSALSEMNITPLIDVMLVLLIIFIVTAPVLPRQLDAALPQSSAASPARIESAKLLLEVRADGSVQLDGRPLDMGTLAERLADARAADDRVQVSIHADASASYQAMAEALSLVRQAEITQVAVLP
ncbi:ExbD/TolR family protein [Pseudoxanthomonas composti]|uniref:Biopolymer transporter ExbD n=1 Tax=Pseudoxanthomonas composti TaxID=2137479 RepID=A0A4Q1JV74_9GAMM|nr:biopolymer transporter ExbD [Pseudoxanthomonas composti]RXR06049.1 biopolymer transporter ExbD [Pseudoxanthomonas composti]